jgi:hypothetical protein
VRLHWPLRRRHCAVKGCEMAKRAGQLALMRSRVEVSDAGVSGGHAASCTGGGHCGRPQIQDRSVGELSRSQARIRRLSTSTNLTNVSPKRATWWCVTFSRVETYLPSTTTPLLNCSWQSPRKAVAPSIDGSRPWQRRFVMLLRTYHAQSLRRLA